MPLQALDSQSYVRRTRLLVDSDKRDESSLSQFDFVFELPTPYERVIGLELVGYNMKRDVQQTLIADNPPFYGNLFIDVYMDNKSTFTDPYYFTVELAPRNYTSAADFAVDLTTALNNAMDAGGHGTYNTGLGVSWAVTVSSDDSLILLDYTVTGGNTYTQFLFGTGPNAHRSAARVLGFPEGVDTQEYREYIVPVFGTAFIDKPQQSASANLNRWRYIDVRIDEFRELDPVARIPLLGPNDLKEGEDLARVRLLTNPVRELSSMRFKLTMPDGSAPLERSLGGFDLVFDVLLLAPETGIPTWVQQKLEY